LIDVDFAKDDVERAKNGRDIGKLMVAAHKINRLIRESLGRRLHLLEEGQIDARNGQLQMVHKQPSFCPQLAQYRDVRIEPGVSNVLNSETSSPATA
jgi:hypothetical protein